MTFLTRRADVAFVLLRVVAGFLLACHGAQKLFGVLGGQKITGGLLLAAGWIEFVTGVLVAVGLLTVPAALLASGEMAVAYFRMHAPHALFPIVNKGELAVAYCFLFLFVAAHGAGRYSLDGAIRR